MWELQFGSIDDIIGLNDISKNIIYGFILMPLMEDLRF